MRKIISLLFVFFLLIVNVNATELNLYSEKYILYNMNDNMIIDEKDAYDKTSIASLTKIMTVIVAIENIEDYDKKITITHDMIDNIEWDVAVVGFHVGDSVTYNDLLYGAILSSGADAVNALALSIGGSYDDFVKMMNDKVKKLGLENTNFTNVVGLYDSEHYSSAYDMAQILIYALKNDKFKEIFETKYYKSSSNINMKSTLSKYNGDISYIKGAKTGYISKSGNCLASISTIDDVNYLLVTLNSYSDVSYSSIKDAINAYTYYSKNYSYQNIVDTKDIVVTLKTKYAKEDTIDIYSNETLEYYLKNDFNKKDLEYVYDGLNEISYFTKSGIKLGTIKIIYNEKELNSFDLIYNSSLTFSIWLLLWDYKYYILGFILFISLLVLVKIKKGHKRK